MPSATAPWVESGRLTAGGKQLEYACFGPPPEAAPTLVLVHEGLGSVTLWRDLPTRLAAATGLGVFAWSRAGYGRSETTALPRPMDYLTREAIGPLPEILDAMGIGRLVMIGHSDGATIAAEYAARVHDARLAGSVLIAPHFFVEDKALAGLARAKTAYETGSLRDRLAKYHDDVDAAFYGWNATWLNPAFRDWNIEPVLARITTPVLVMQGVEDEYATLAQIEVVARRAHGPVTLAALDGLRHQPHLEDPDQVVARIADFAAACLADNPV